MKSKKQDILVRLQKVISDCGVTSRRKAEDMIVEGRVTVNGQIVTELGTKVNPNQDIVVVDGQILDPNFTPKIYIVFNKPRCCMTTLSDPQGRPTVMDYFKDIPDRIYPVGRLDYLSEGLIIMTNDGEMANMIMHPRFEVTKVYDVKVFGAITEPLLKKLRAGVTIEGDFVKPLSVRVIRQLAGKTWLEFRLGEGKNREIRKICESCSITVDKLKRVAIENITIEGLAPGRYHFMTKRQLLDALGMREDGTRVPNHKPYESPKKTVDLKLKGPQSATPADDRAFFKFRKEFYYKTLETLKEKKELPVVEEAPKKKIIKKKKD